MTDIVILMDPQIPAAVSCSSGNNTELKPEPSQCNPVHYFPLMSNAMDKETLIYFTQLQGNFYFETSQYPDQVESYFFWKIMELFCHKNGEVMMCEIAALLLKSYGLLRKRLAKVKDAQTWKEWCLPLARLLFSDAPDDEHREAVIKMGDDLASRNLIYPAHICYVVAKMDLGSRRHFELVGCNSSRIPFGTMVFTDPFLRTEMYEYALWMTSGRAQPSFQIFKLCQASREYYVYSKEKAHRYCEVITRAVITFPDRFTRSFVEQLLLLSCELQNKNAEEPEWLLELRQLHKNKLANTNFTDDPEQHMVCTSQRFRVSEIQELKNEPPNEIPELQPPGPEQLAELEALLSSRYQLGDLLGNGCFGFVFKAVRIADNKKVAVKVVKKSGYVAAMKLPGEAEELPSEVALMRIVSEPPVCSNVIELLEWFDMGHQFVMVMERPSPSMDLLEFMQLQGGFLPEAQARDIMAQVIRAARHCCDRGVVHRDIKAENLIINPETLEVKLIDFGCGELLKDTPSTDFFGTMYFAPPEWLFRGGYMGAPATIWGLGILLFHFLSGNLPFISSEDLNYGYLNALPDLSQECFQLLIWCMDLNPETRPTFEQLARHEWFTGGSSGQSPDSS
ncbi:serine/threonine-protein kinase DCLK3-like [Hemibagrus wyckioides]|uniref:serine/threonine-protein kinase DCLK3-like n=1 Tax=Hemibagrus wyckioides TaxID=337641 RepID=UPI00266B7C25|nr:serine/threonine-protein kinase DCLK3-like [Hemibagrus wyckioides]